jgi:adenylate cyclase
MERTTHRRRLAAIVCMDVAGYSRLMGADEEGTLARLKKLLRELIEPSFETYGGRVVKTTGDGVLGEFSSAVEAVACAVEIQRAAIDRNADVSRERRLDFRVGINLADVIVEPDGDLFGDGVNLAARLQALAEPGGICVSGLVYGQVAAHVSAVFISAGLHQVKNFARPVEVWRWSAAAARSGRGKPTGLVTSDKPSVVVLPFSTNKGDTQGEFAVDGLVEDLISGLSRSSQLFVIARHSSLTYKGQEADVRQIARDLGVRYIVAGSIRLSGDKYRVNAQLIDGYDAHSIWTDSYDVPCEGFYEAQDVVVRGIVASVQTHITLHEGESPRGRPRESQGTDELLKQAWSRAYQLTPEALRDAAALAEAALEQSPGSDRAYQLLAVSHHHMAYLGYAEDWVEAVDRAYREACRAVDMFDGDEYSQWILASTLVLKREHERAIAGYTRAIEINPNFSLAYGSMGTALAWAGKWEEALRSNEIAIRSNPRDPSIFLRFFVNGLAHFVAAHYDEAQAWLARTVQRKKTFRNAHLLRIASLALMGEEDRACRAASEMQEEFAVVRPEHLRELPFIRADDAEALARGLRMAGVIE